MSTKRCRDCVGTGRGDTLDLDAHCETCRGTGERPVRTTEWGEDVAEARETLRTELLEWTRIATEASEAWRELDEHNFPREAEMQEARFKAAVDAAEHIAGLLRALPPEPVTEPDWSLLVGG